MKAYFVGSIKGKSKYLDNYKKIIKTLEDMGYEVAENTLAPTEKLVYSLSDEGKIKQYKSVLKWINSSDLVVAEASYSSLGIGFEISLAMEKGKPVVVLYTEEDTPHFIQGIESGKLFIVKYDLSNLKSILEGILDEAQEQMDVRFNFFVPPKIVSYLDWITKHRKLPRAVFLRRLIEDHMKRNKEYKAQ